MIVYKLHSMSLPALHITHIIKKAMELFGDGIELRCNQRQITDHWHVHIIVNA